MATGYFTNKGEPCIEIEIADYYKRRKKLTFLIDTGFDGFLVSPLKEVENLFFPTKSVLPWRHANGETRDEVAHTVRAFMDGDTQTGVLVISHPNTEPALGMDFLRKFEARLVINPVDQTVQISRTLGRSEQERE